ncbi:MAG: transposase [Treponema sp.]|nr:transposase [Treponema sp.]
MKGASVFIAIAVITDIIDVSRFRNSKTFAPYLRPAPGMPDSNTSTANRRTNKWCGTACGGVYLRKYIKC